MYRAWSSLPGKPAIRSGQAGLPVPMPSGVRQVLRSLLEEIGAAAGGDLLGVYLCGSVASGDFNEGVSDIDLMVALTGAITPDLLARIDRAHHRFWHAYLDFADRIDIIYVPAAVLSGHGAGAGGPAADGADPPLLATVSPGSPLSTTAADQDWVLNWQLALRAEVTLVGPSVESVVSPLPAAEIRALVAARVPPMRRRFAETPHRGGQAYLVLTLCRVLFSLTTNGQTSKAAAAAWAARRWPHLRPLIETALEWRMASAVRDETPLPAALAAKVSALLTIAEEKAAEVSLPGSTARPDSPGTRSS